MAEFVAPKAPFNISKYFLERHHYLGIGVPLEYIADVLKVILEMIVNLRSEGRRVVGDTPFTTKSLQKITKRKLIHPTSFIYRVIANDCLSSYFERYAREFEENLLDDTFIDSDKIFLNFYYIDDLKKEDPIHVWETWKIRIIITPMKSLTSLEKQLNNIASVITKQASEPLPHTISLRDCKRIFKRCRDQAWLYRHFVRQGKNLPCDHVLHLNTNVENIGKILNIIFQSILYYRCKGKLRPCDDGTYKSDTLPFTIEIDSDFCISYPRICCKDLGHLLRSRANYCRKCVRSEHCPRKIKTFYLSFYQLSMKDDVFTTRKICERWQIVCQMNPVNSDAPSNLPHVLLYIERTNFPESLRVSPTLEYEDLYEYYFTTMLSCTPPRFYIHS